MSLKLMEFPNMDQKKAILETHSQAMESFSNFVNHISHQPYNLNPDLTNTTVASIKKLSNLHNRTGRARFRSAPVPPPQTSIPSTSTPPLAFIPSISTPPLTFIPSTSTPPLPPQFQQPQKSQNQSLTLDFIKSRSNPKSLDLVFPKEGFSVSSNSSFMSSAITADNSVSNGRLGTSSLFLNPAVSGGKPPLSSSSMKKSCHDHSGEASGSNKCHCKKKKNRTRRIEIVPAKSSKIADIPADSYSWRKYGQKPIKGSPHPRGYYRCSKSKQCPARKKVERSVEDPNMLIVTYEEEHRHHEMQGNISGFGSTLGGN